MDVARLVDNRVNAARIQLRRVFMGRLDVVVFRLCQNRTVEEIVFGEDAVYNCAVVICNNNKAENIKFHVRHISSSELSENEIEKLSKSAAKTTKEKRSSGNGPTFRTLEMKPLSTKL